MQLKIRDSPRSIALTDGTTSLVFRAAAPNPGGSSTRCIVGFGDRDLSEFRPLTSLPVYGCLGLITVDKDVFICVITGSSQVAEVKKHETARRIHGVEFHCINRADWDMRLVDINGMRVENGELEGFETTAHTPDIEHPCGKLKHVLSGGTFYFSTDCDLTNRLQSRSELFSTSTKGSGSGFEPEAFDDQFMWNKYMIGELLKFRANLGSSEKRRLDRCAFLTTAIRGFVESVPVQVGIRPGNLTLISRLSCERAGTRFNSRGIDDQGHVSNFVETETVLETADWVFSFVQVRGSIPTFWEQVGSQILGQKIQVTRSKEASQPAFEKHFGALIEKYGAVHIVNLLGSRGDEPQLSERYALAVTASGEMNGQIRSTNWDFHYEVKNDFANAQRIWHLLKPDADAFAFYVEDQKDGSPILEQNGVFRTNCLDCLDRTNMIQSIICRMALESFLSYRNDVANNLLWSGHSRLWADNGDALSKIYAGTGALKSSFTRKGKMSFAGALSDATKSVSRMYINNFQDKDRQNTIDMLLGRLVNQQPVPLYDPINDYVRDELRKRKDEYTSTGEIKVFVGTYNLNGKMPNDKLEPWLFPQGRELKHDMYVIGFQEIVELTPQQIMATDPAKRRFWEAEVQETLNRKAKEGEQYVFLRSGQLVGAALMIFVKSSLISSLKNVEGAIKKTGLKGMSGNKGAVAIRMDFENTRLCFVTAHLAAGHANYDERNRDYHIIADGLKFQRGRKINDHDSVIFFGDFNYRISLPLEEVRHLIEVGDYGQLYSEDQLNRQMVAGNVFSYYSEDQITFAPTYKFDNGTDQYDTSEKQRIPAWTDRILRRGTNVRQLAYESAPLRFSDHRPVYGVFEMGITKEDEGVRDRLYREIYDKRREEIGEPAAGSSKMDMEDLVERIDTRSSILPPPSSEKHKWWLEDNQPAKVPTPQPPSGAKEWTRNPRRPVNPFQVTEEPDWVKVDRPVQRAPSVASTRSAASVASTASIRAPRPVPPPKPGGLSKAASVPGDAGARRLPPPLPTRRDSTKSVQEAPPQLPPRRETNGSSQQREKESEKVKPPPPPPRKNPNPGVMDDIEHATENGMQMSGWTPLQPTK
ncbi:Inositol-1,4,5-trisphosphate 5-phosphatase 1 [Saitoella coloradoensis]